MKKSCRYLILILFYFAFFSCQKMAPLQEKNKDVSIRSQSYSLSDLNKSRVSELFIILFRNDLNKQQWSEIFKQTQKLSSNKRLLSTIGGLFDEESENVRSVVIKENAQLLQNLSANSVYLLNWSFGDENCRFLFQENLNLICKPRVLDNPLNGGLPKQQGVIELIRPDPIIDDIKLPYLSLILFRESPLLKIQLRLKMEDKNEDQSRAEFWFKGDVKILNHSFLSEPYPYGYAEMSLEKLLAF